MTVLGEEADVPCPEDEGLELEERKETTAQTSRDEEMVRPKKMVLKSKKEMMRCEYMKALR